jgi:hypothetical protein
LDVQRAVRFKEIANRLIRGIHLRDELRRPKNFKSGDEHIKPTLRRLDYTDREVTVILKARTLTAATYALLADQDSDKIAGPSLRASVSRGKKLLEAAARSDAVDGADEYLS